MELPDVQVPAVDALLSGLRREPSERARSHVSWPLPADLPRLHERRRRPAARLSLPADAAGYADRGLRAGAAEKLPGAGSNATPRQHAVLRHAIADRHQDLLLDARLPSSHAGLELRRATSGH